MHSIADILEDTSTALLHALDERPAARRLLAGDVGIHEYASFLGQTLLYIRHTRPLLRRAGERLRALGEHPLFAALFLEKSEEEEGHDQWILEDLVAIGRPVLHETPLVPSPPVAAYVAWNHFMVESSCPLGFLGTAYVLERLSTSRAATTANHLVARRRIPGIERGVRFLRGHADADHGHTEALRRALEGLTSPAAREAVTLSAAVTASLYAGMFADAPAGVDARPGISASPLGLNEAAMPGG